MSVSQLGRKARKPKRKSPLASVPRVRAKRKAVDGAAVRQHMEPNELKAFFKYLPPTSFWYPYFYIQYIYGCRLSEPALIFDEDVSFKKRQITIRRLKKSKEIEGFREQVCVADARVLDCVKVAQRWKEHKKVAENPFLFASGRQRSDKLVGAERLSQLRSLNGWQAVSRFTASRMFNHIAKEIKLPEHLRHSQVLRHTRSVMMLAAGASPELVRTTLGHSSVKMAQKYVETANALRGQLSEEFTEMGLGL